MQQIDRDLQDQDHRRLNQPDSRALGQQYQFDDPAHAAAVILTNTVVGYVEDVVSWVTL